MNPSPSISVVICLYKRLAHLEEQLQAIRSQTIQAAEIVILQNESHLDLNNLLVSNPDVKLIRSDINSLYTRWIIGYICEGDYIAVLDDDCIIGTRWLENCLRCSREHNCMVGPSGRIYKGNDYEVERFFDRVGLEDNFEIRPYDKDIEVDWVCNSYFFKKSWIQYLTREPRHDGAQLFLDDIQLAKSLLRYGGIRTFVPAQPKEDQSLQGYLRPDYGDDEHALWRQWDRHRSLRRQYLRELWSAGPSLFLAHKPVPTPLSKARTAQSRQVSVRFIVVVPFYTTEYLAKCLRSLVEQTWTHWICVVVNDNCPAPIPEAVQQLIDQDPRMTLVHNAKREYPLRSREIALEHARPEDEDIVVHLDGDDWLATPRALEIVSQRYQGTDILLTYGNCQRLKDGKLSPVYMYALSNEAVTATYGFHRPFLAYPDTVVATRDFRHYPWCGLHLRTFRYRLYRQLNKADLLDETGNYFKFATDMAVMIPLLEMAGDRIAFIEEVLYIYNLEGEQHVRYEFPDNHTPHNCIRSKKQYPRLP